MKTRQIECGNCEYKIELNVRNMFLFTKPISVIWIEEQKYIQAFVMIRCPDCWKISKILWERLRDGGQYEIS